MDLDDANRAAVVVCVLVEGDQARLSRLQERAQVGDALAFDPEGAGFEFVGGDEDERSGTVFS